MRATARIFYKQKKNMELKVMSIVKVDTLPDIVREGNSSELVLEIRECLKESYSSGAAFKIDGLDSDVDFHNSQQRIRNQAGKLGMKVTVRRDKTDSALYFAVVPIVNNEEVSDDE
jgi:hypothetical protein